MLLTKRQIAYHCLTQSTELKYMETSHPYDFRCKCGFVRKETIERALSGRLDPPVWCPNCRRLMELDYYDVDKQAKKVGLLPLDDGD
nr:MAG TPA: Protein of unknown function (DUF1178) [Caudoviricetes sp.]